MKCRSRSTLQIIVGALNVIVGVGFCFILLFRTNCLPRNGDSFGFPNEVLILILSVWLIMTVPSVLFIIGVVKRRYQLMTPWLVLSAIDFGFNGTLTVVGTVMRHAMGQYSEIPTLLLFVGFSCIGIQGCILYKLYTLYSEIIAEKFLPQFSTGDHIDFTNANCEQPNKNNKTPV